MPVYQTGTKVDEAKWDRLISSIPANYAVFKIGSTIYAEADFSGGTDYSGTDAATVIQSALNSLTSGRSWEEKVVIKGNFTIDTTITIPSYTILEICGKLSLDSNTNADLLANADTSNTDIIIIGGELNGNKSNQTAASRGISLDGVTRFWVENIYVHDFYTHGIHIAKTSGRTSSQGFLRDIIATDNGTSGVGGSGIVLGTAGNANSVFVEGFYVSGNIENGVGLETGANCGLIGPGVARDQASDNGVYVASTINDVTLSNFVSRGNSASGVSIVGSNVTASNIICFDNGSAGATYGGIRIHTAASDVNVSNCYCYDGGNNNQNYGISIEGTANHIHIQNCNLRGNVDTPLKLTTTGTDLTFDGEAQSSTPVDLSGSAVTQYLLHTETPLHLARAHLLYTEASSADAGITVEIGKEADRDYYYTGATESSKAQWYTKTVTLLKNDIAAGDTVTFYSPGGKTGTGEIVCIIEYLIGA